MHTQIWISAFTLLAISSQVASQTDSCATHCSDYDGILVGCQSESGSLYDSCVCNDPNFQTYVSECIACEGTNSAPYKFQQNCKSVPPDCNVACHNFGTILQGCGDSSSSNYKSCVCSGAYDETYSNTFNQDFMDCVTCENGGGQAADWEAYCCVSTGGCIGMSAEASGEAVSLRQTMTQPAPTTTTATPTTTNPVTTSSSGAAIGDRTMNALGFGLGQLVVNGLIIML